MTALRSIAILGAGRVGSALARVLVQSGHEVTVAGSGDPAAIALTARILMPGAKARWAADAAREADIVFLAVPLHKFALVNPKIVEGKTVVDVMNYWPPVNGRLETFDDANRGTSEVIQDALPGARVLKSFNHLTYHELEGDRLPAGSPHRRAIAVVGPLESAALVARMIDRIGFDPVIDEDPNAGRALQPGGAAFGRYLTRDTLRRMLERASESAVDRV